MAENSGTVAILVALIGAAGLLGAKYLDIIGKPAATATSPVVPANGPAPVQPKGDTPPVEPSDDPGPVVPRRNVATPAPARTATIDESDSAAESPAIPGVVDVSGRWHDFGHRDYSIEQNGMVVRLVGPLFPMGMPGLVGNGGISWVFTDTTGNSGRCAGPLTGTQLQIVCTSMAGVIPFPLHRPNSG